MLVLGVVMLLVAVVAGLRPHLVAGAAQSVPVPGPPAVGDCVLDPLPADSLDGNTTVTSGGTVPVYPALQIRPCSGTRYAEVVAVLATPDPPVVQGPAANPYLVDPNLGRCYSVALRYLGVPTPPILHFWELNLQFTVALSRPSSRQEAAGQHWAACIVKPTGVTYASPADQQYGSSIRGALQTGRQRNQLGSCAPTVDWNASDGGGYCAGPHSLEVFAFGGSGDHPVTRNQVELTCQQVVRQLTGIPDPTVAGALAIQVHITDNNSDTAITTAQIPARSSLTCGVATTTGTRKLGGSLIALGQQPIPWA